MGRHRTPGPRAHVGRCFLLALLVSGMAFGILGRVWAEDVTVWLHDVPATSSGWQVLGWALGGPPLLLAFMTWLDGHRYSADQREFRASVLGLWLGIGGFLVPALAESNYEQFGVGIDVGAPLAFGWTCAAVANLAAIAFAVALSLVRRGVGVRNEHNEWLTLRFVEAGWTVLLVGALYFAAYGASLGFVY